MPVAGGSDVKVFGGIAFSESTDGGLETESVVQRREGYDELVDSDSEREEVRL